MPAEIEVLYRVDRPSGSLGVIEVYGEPSMGWYEWRVKVSGGVIYDTARYGSYGMQYGSASIALRDALNYDEPPAYVDELRGLATGLDNLAAHYRRLAAHHEIKATPVPPAMLDELADRLTLMCQQLSEALPDTEDSP